MVAGIALFRPDGRFMKGMALVVAVQAVFWTLLGAMVIGRGAPFETMLGAIFGSMIAIPLSAIVFIVGLLPAFTIWSGLRAICQRLNYSDRASALLSGPLVTLAGAFAFTLWLLLFGGGFGRFDHLYLPLTVAFAFPGMLAAAIYAQKAWPAVESESLA
jgi:hypothetical protein